MTCATSDGLKAVDAFWAGYFGCSPGDLGEARTLVVPHAALEGYDDVLAFRRGPSCIVSVPRAVPESGREKLRRAPPERAFDPELLARSLVVWRDQVSPAAWLGVCLPADFDPAPPRARKLTEDESDAVRRLAEACGEAAWSATGLPCDPTFGVFADGELVAASGTVTLGGVLAYVGVVTHPERRGRGHAKAAAGASLRDAFERDLIPLWRTPVSNGAAVAVARSLGFRPYALTIDVQLTCREF